MERLKSQLKLLNYYVLLLLFFFVPLSKQITVLLLILLMINTLITADYRSTFRDCKKNPKNAAILFFSLLYVLYLFGLINTFNFDYAFFDLEVKFSLLMLPVIFFLIKDIFFTKDLLLKYLRFFIAGILTNVVICLLIACYKYLFISPSLDAFFYSPLSFFFHPSYFSMYLNFAVIIILFASFSDIILFNHKKYITVILLIVFSFVIFLLSSKAGIISLILIYLIYVLVIVITQKRYKSGLLILTLLFLAAVILLTTMPSVKLRLSVGLAAFKNNNKGITTNGESSSDRIHIWGASLDIIKLHPVFGVGTGDVKDVLLDKYKEKEINFAYQQKLNAHNQYLQTYIAIGLLGFILLLLSFIIPIIYSFRHRYYLYLLFLLLLMFNLLVESMFENQAGVVFYAFMNSFLFIIATKTQRHKDTMKIK